MQIIQLGLPSGNSALRFPYPPAKLFQARFPYLNKNDNQNIIERTPS